MPADQDIARDQDEEPADRAAPDVERVQHAR